MLKNVKVGRVENALFRIFMNIIYLKSYILFQIILTLLFQQKPYFLLKPKNVIFQPQIWGREIRKIDIIALF